MLPPGMKKLLPQAAPPVISYDFSDVARQTGYKQYYLYQGSSGAYMLLDNNNFLTEAVIKSWSASSTELKEVITITSDLNFNVPQNIKGDFFVNFHWDFVPGGATPGIAVASAAIYHYDGAATTLLGNAAGKPISSTGGVSSSAAALIKINIPNVVHFKIGDSLRLIESVSASGAAGSNANIYFNPHVQEFSDKIYIPYKIEV